MQSGLAEAQGPRGATQEGDTRARGGGCGVVLHFGKMLVIPHAGDHAGVGLDARQLADAGVDRVAGGGDQVAGDGRQMRAQPVGGVDYARQLGLAQKRAQVNVAEVQQAQAVEVGGKSGNRHVDFAHAKVQPADQRTV